MDKFLSEPMIWRVTHLPSLFIGGDLVSVKLHCPNGSPITAEVEDNDDGTYTASFTPVSKGDHQITVHARGKPIQGSSFDLQVWWSFVLQSLFCFVLLPNLYFSVA